MFKTLGAAILAIALMSLATCASTDADKTGVADFNNYENWTKINQETITGDLTDFLGSAHEGPSGFREVYVNDAGESVGLGQVDFPYPEGTIVVKESFAPDSSGKKGNLTGLTIMVKREAGYDPDNSDWEYLMTSADGAVQMQGKVGMCIDCHTGAYDTDYVFTYRE